MNVCVTTVTLRTGLGTQTVTGLVNGDGVPFTPTHLFAVNGSSARNVLHSEPAGSFTAASANTNATEIATGTSGYSGSADVWVPLVGTPLKAGSSGSGAGPPAGVCSLQARLAAGGLVYRTVQITAVTLGGFTLTVLSEDVAVPTAVLFVVFGAVPGVFEMAFLDGAVSGAHTIPTPFPATGLINPKTLRLATSGGVSTENGGHFGWGWGWDSPHGGPGSAHLVLGNITDPPASYQSHLSYDNGVSSGTPPVAFDRARVTAWTPTQLAFNVDPDVDHRGFIVGGPQIVTASGTVIQAPTAGPQVVTTGVDAACVCLVSVGRPPSTTIQAGAESCVGCTDGTRQAAFWVGETATAAPLTGACVLSDASLLRFAAAGPAGPDTAFTAIATIGGLSPLGTFTLDWTVSDGIGREILWFVIGTAPPPPIPPAPPGTIEPIRRLRQAPVLWDGAEGKRLKFPGFELLTEAGGPRDTDVAMPIVLQWSDDGGHSWGHEHRNEGARIGEHRYRYRWLRLGQARNRVFRVVCSADAKVVFIDALLSPDPVQGSS